MEEPVGAQLAVHIALHTLKDRCKSLQQRVTVLEEENLNLRVQCSKNNEKNASLTEIDELKGQVTELSEQKHQLLNKVRMVTGENQELWNKLSRLTHVNQNLGIQLSKINDSLVQYTTKSKETHSPLIRSKTFTQDEPHTKVLQKNLEENGKICAELEEISLKIISSFAQGKNELESLYSEIVDLQCGDNLITDSCGFYYDDYDNNVLENFNSILDELKATKQVVFNQKAALETALNKINKLQESKRKSICDSNLSKKIEMLDKSTSTPPQSEIQESPTEPINQVLPEASAPGSPEGMDMICPVCCKNFCTDTDFQVFHEHVEKHFTDESFELL